MKPFLALLRRALVTLLLLAPQLSAQAVPAEAVGRAHARAAASGRRSAWACRGPSPVRRRRWACRCARASASPPRRSTPAAACSVGASSSSSATTSRATKLGAQIVRDFIHRERVTAGLGIVNTGVALASQRHYQMARIPVITSVATGSLITKQFQPPISPKLRVPRLRQRHLAGRGDRRGGGRPAA